MLGRAYVSAVPGALEGSGDRGVRRLAQGLIDALRAGRWLGGLDTPVTPTLFKACLSPDEHRRLRRVHGLERALARMLTRRAEEEGYLLVGPLEVSLWARPDVPGRRPEFELAFRESESLELSAAALRQAQAERGRLAG